MFKAKSAYLLLQILGVFIFALNTYSQGKNGFHLTEFSDLPTEHNYWVDCNDVISKSDRNDINKFVIDQIEIISKAFDVKAPEIRYFTKSIAGKETNRAFVANSSCSGSEGKIAILIGTGLWNKNIKMLEMKPEQEKTILTVIISHELGHLKQNTLDAQVHGKERELHADFLAGWFLAHCNLLKLGVTDRKTVMATAVYELAQIADYDEQNVQHHGRPETRVQMLLSGFTSDAINSDIAFQDGIRVIENNELFQNPATIDGKNLREEVEKAKIMSFKERIAFEFKPNNSTTNQCFISDPLISNYRYKELRCSIKTDTGDEKGDKLFKEITDDVISMMPKKTIKIKIDKDTYKIVAPFYDAPLQFEDTKDENSFKIERKQRSNLQNEINVETKILLAQESYPVKEELPDNSNILTQEINTGLENIGMMSPDYYDKPEFAIGGVKCNVTSFISSKISGKWWKVSCGKFQPDRFNLIKTAVWGWIPKGWRYCEQRFGEEESSFHSWGDGSDFVKQIDIRANGDTLQPFDITFLVEPKFIKKSTVSEKRTINSIGQEFVDASTVISRLVDFEGNGGKYDFNFPKNTTVDESISSTIDGTLGFNVSIEKTLRENDIQSAKKRYLELVNGIKSSLPLKYNEEYNYQIYKASVEADDVNSLIRNIEVGLYENSIKLKVVLLSTNPIIFRGKKSYKPNDVGKEIINQANKVKNLKTDGNSQIEFSLLQSSGEIVNDFSFLNSVNNPNIDYRGISFSFKDKVKENFKKIKDGIISILSDEWIYGDNDYLFVAARKGCTTQSKVVDCGTNYYIVWFKYDNEVEFFILSSLPKEALSIKP